jgi:hypothetical protein
VTCDHIQQSTQVQTEDEDEERHKTARLKLVSKAGE